MKDKMTVTYNGKEYEATYNRISGYYEVYITSPTTSGETTVNTKYTDILGYEYQNSQTVFVYPKQPEVIETEKIFMWIFDHKDFKIKDVVELIDDYEIEIDEETNAVSIVNTIKKTTAKADDIVVIKRNGKIVYWGIISSMEDNKNVYQYTLKYILNIFDINVPLRNNITMSTDWDSSTASYPLIEGVFVIKSSMDYNKVIDVYGGYDDIENNIQIWNRNGGLNQKFRINKTSLEEKDLYNVYSIQPLSSETGKVLDVYENKAENRRNIQLYTSNEGVGQKWFIFKSKIGDTYKIYTAIGGEASINDNPFVIDVYDNNPTEGTNIILFQNKEENDKNQRWYLERQNEYDITDEGAELFIGKYINYSTFKDILYPIVTPKTKQCSIPNVNENLFNLRTYMNNCTKLYNIRYTFGLQKIIDKYQFTIEKLKIIIENSEFEKQLIDLTSQKVFNVEEIYETNIVQHVKAITNTDEYNLYLLTDRTTTTNSEDPNRAEGRSETIFVENYEEAPQKALDAIQANRYNHNISFDMIGDLIPVGTPVVIKKKNGDVVDTYVSGIKITKLKAISYTFGNIRVNFIDKLRKERENR